MSRTQESPPRSKTPNWNPIDVVVVGAGFAGMYALHRFREMGLSARVFERGTGVGGTWYWNRYPGARCDVQSMEYSYQFSEELQQEWKWTERFSPQPEILAYANHVADRFDLRRDIQFETTVTAAHYHEESRRWHVQTDRGDLFAARYCVMATGCLSSWNVPKFPGLDRFEGQLLQTGQWPHEEVDFSGKRVAIIGTGSSSIQAIPIIAQQAESLVVFQRTPNFSVPARNGLLDPGYESEIKSRYKEFRAENSAQPGGLYTKTNDTSALAVDDSTRQGTFEDRWREGGLPFLAAFNDIGLNRAANDTAADFIRSKIHEIVDNPEVAELLCPDTTVGCKRPCVDSNYYATFNLPHVHLVDISANPIAEILPQGVRVGDDVTEVDALVLATGFDAMTGALLAVDIRGREGLRLSERWSEGPKAYLGLAVSGFPNLFTITGPGSPSVLTNMIPAIEQHVNWIADCIGHLDSNGITAIEPERDAEEAWVSHVNDVASLTLYPTGCNSWYQGANIPGKPRVFMPYIGYPPYVEKCNQVVSRGYEGFALD